MTIGQVYNRCIGTVAEGPEQGMRTDDTRILEPTEMQVSSKTAMADFTARCIVKVGHPLKITERRCRGIRTLTHQRYRTSRWHCLPSPEA